MAQHNDSYEVDVMKYKENLRALEFKGLLFPK